jgi:hypothetical protein
VKKNNGIKGNYHCIKCGHSWGDGNDTKSYGVCIACFAEYVNNKKKSKGLDPCFGKLDQSPDVCSSCKWRKFCEEYYRECCAIK